MSPKKKTNANKRKGGPQKKVYRKVEMTLLTASENDREKNSEMMIYNSEHVDEGEGGDGGGEPIPKRREKHPEILEFRQLL